MDAGWLTVALAGAAAGFAASAVPGFHVNALALLALALAPASGPEGALFLVTALAASPFGLALSSTFLGGTSDDSALSSLPSHVLAREGRAAEAVALQAWGALLGLFVALPLAYAAQPLLVAAWPWLSLAMPALLLLVVALLVVTEPRRPALLPRLVVVPWGTPGGLVVEGPLRRGEGGRLRIGRQAVHDPDDLLAQEPEGERISVRVERVRIGGWLARPAGMGAAMLALALSGALGLAALPLGARSPLGLPASPLLPLLAGLFAMPSLLDACTQRGRRATHARMRVPRHRLRDLLAAAMPGAAVSALLGVVPGVSGSHAALLAPRGRTPERALVRLAAVNGGAVVFTLLAWHALGKARAGALVAADALAPTVAWRGGPLPMALLDEAAAVLLAAGVGCALARLATQPLSTMAARVGPRRFAGGGALLLVVLTVASTGALGLAELGAATLVGASIARLGVRRGLGMGVILVPALARALGLD